MSDIKDQGPDDQTLSETYRSLATEQPAAHLDAKILKDARAAAKPRYSRMRTWTRPLAWAATIGLSLAIVLQLTETPEVPAPSVVQPASKAVAETSASERQDLDITPQPDKKREALTAPPENVEKAFAPDTQKMRKAQKVGRATAGSAELTKSSIADARLAADEVATEPAQEPYCDDAARSTATSWLECIEQLRAKGARAEADEELRAYEAWVSQQQAQ